MRETNYPERITFRGASQHKKKLEKLIESKKATDLSEAIRYCIEKCTCEATT